MSSDEGAWEGPFYLSWVIYPKGSERVLFREVPKESSFLISDLGFPIYFIDPKRSEAVLFRKVIQCSKSIGFCSIRFMWYPSESHGGGGAVSGGSSEWRGAVCRNWIWEICIKVSVLGEVRIRIGRVQFFFLPKLGKGSERVLFQNIPK